MRRQRRAVRPSPSSASRKPTALSSDLGFADVAAKRSSDRLPLGLRRQALARHDCRARVGCAAANWWFIFVPPGVVPAFVGPSIPARGQPQIAGGGSRVTSWWFVGVRSESKPQLPESKSNFLRSPVSVTKLKLSEKIGIQRLAHVAA